MSCASRAKLLHNCTIIKYMASFGNTCNYCIFEQYDVYLCLMIKNKKQGYDCCSKRRYYSFQKAS